MVFMNKLSSEKGYKAYQLVVGNVFHWSDVEPVGHVFFIQSEHAIVRVKQFLHNQMEKFLRHAALNKARKKGCQ